MRAVEQHGGEVKLRRGRLHIGGAGRLPAELLAEVKERRAELAYELGKQERINAKGARQEALDRVFIRGGPVFMGKLPWGRR